MISLIKGLGRFEGVVLSGGKRFSDREREGSPLYIRMGEGEPCPLGIGTDL